MLSHPLKSLPFFPEITRFIVAYSGGLDSHVLLHSLAAIRNTLNKRELIALHINHGLSATADEWTTHCKAQCDALDVSFTHFKVDAHHKTGESPEAVAREARYQAFRTFMKPGDCLLTAHHQDDQAETLLIQLLRGAGPRGLAAMPTYSYFAHGWHARPLLHCSRDELQRYAQQESLLWVEDGSNTDTRFDRNFLRHDIMPILKARFPAMATTLSRSAGLCAEAAELLAVVATDDIEAVKVNNQSLSVSGLQLLGEVRARGRERGRPTPSAAPLQCGWADVGGASDSRAPLVRWPGGEARRYRDELFIRSPLSEHNTALALPWDGQQTLSIPGLGNLNMEELTGQGVALTSLVGRELEIRFRQGGERLRPVGRDGHHALKKLFQEVGIPPWLRERIPLLYADEQLLAVAGLWVADEAAAMASEPGLRLDWTAQD